MFRLNPRFLFAFATILTAIAPPISNCQEKQKSSQSKSEIQVWKGVIEVPSSPLEFVLRFKLQNPQAPTATIDIATQNAFGLSLTDVEISDKLLQFTLPVGAPAVFQLELAADGKTAKGTMVQHGQTFPVSAKIATGAEAADAGPKRPQTPEPPYPYKSEEVTFKNTKDEVTLAGTLTLPKRMGPHPAVVLITGSGPQDRDEALFGHKPFLVISDHLSRRGIAVLRYDDRGVGESKASMEKLMSSTTANLADDARAAVAFLRRRKDIDPNRIGLIGHSEGGIIAPMIAADDKEVACIVLLAGTGVPGSKVLSGQLEKIASISGTPRENIDGQLKAQAKYMDLIVKKAKPDEIREALRELVILQFEAGGAPKDEAKIKETVDAAMANESPWMGYFIAYDPATSLRKTKCPVLALNGTLDSQVLIDDNIPAIQKSLAEAGNKDVTIKKMKGLNHLFQNAQTGSPAEYSSIEETMSPKALKAISVWLKDRLKVEPRKKGKQE